MGDAYDIYFYSVISGGEAFDPCFFFEKGGGRASF